MTHVPCMPLQTCYVREMSNEISNGNSVDKTICSSLDFSVFAVEMMPD
jgi:hypothetical protein